VINRSSISNIVKKRARRDKRNAQCKQQRNSIIMSSGISAAWRIESARRQQWWRRQNISSIGK